MGTLSKFWTQLPKVMFYLTRHRTFILWTSVQFLSFYLCSSFKVIKANLILSSSDITLHRCSLNKTPQYLFENIAWLPNRIQKLPEKGQKSQYFYITDHMNFQGDLMNRIVFNFLKGKRQGPYNTKHYDSTASTFLQLTSNSKSLGKQKRNPG